VSQKYKVISCFWEDKKTAEYYKKWGWLHTGVDLAVVAGSDLFATYNMTCYQILPYNEQTNPWGNAAYFSFNGLEDSGCVYAHISTFGTLKVGDTFEQGALLPCKSGGNTKESGYPIASSGSHLHFGCWMHGYKNADMGNYTDPLGFFFEGETIEDSTGRAYFVKDNFKHWSPDLVTFFSYGLVPEDIQKMVDPKLGTQPYWTETPSRLKDGIQMEFEGSVHQRLLESMKKNKLINW